MNGSLSLSLTLCWRCITFSHIACKSFLVDSRVHVRAFELYRIISVSACMTLLFCVCLMHMEKQCLSTIYLSDFLHSQDDKSPSCAVLVCVCACDCACKWKAIKPGSRSWRVSVFPKSNPDLDNSKYARVCVCVLVVCACLCEYVCISFAYVKLQAGLEYLRFISHVVAYKYESTTASHRTHHMWATANA